MDTLLVILRKAPYGLIDAAEAVRHAGGASGFDYSAILYLIDSGVYTAKRNQEVGETGFTGLGESLELLSGEMETYACQNSLNARGLTKEDLVEGVKVDDGSALQRALRDAQSVMIF